MIRYSNNINEIIDWEEAALVFELAPLGRSKRDPQRLSNAFMASYSVIYVFDDDKLIGLGRALCDGEYQAAIYDVVLLPQYQGQGIGAEIMKKIRDQLPVENIILYAVSGREGFYEKCGYRRMLTAMAILNPIMSTSQMGYLDIEAGGDGQ